MTHSSYMILIVILVGLFHVSRVPAQETQAVDSSGHRRSGFEFFPILSYDTDVGFGYGGKAFLLDRFSMRESFDIVLFHSTKGERWYRLVASMPDIELRQRTSYLIAVDFLLDYDKLINANFFGIGNSSSYDSRWTYTKTPLEISLTGSRGFTPSLVGQVLVRYRTVENSNVDPSCNLAIQRSPSRATSVSLEASFRYDTRNSFVNPSEGIVLLVEGGWAPKWSAGTVSFTRISLWTQGYVPLRGIVFAGRLGLQQINGTDLPVQTLLPIGGVNTLRGYSQDRFLDRVAGVINFEARFMIFWRLAGVLGWDVGKVWSSLGKLDLRSWPNNPTAGLRLIMDNFLVRLDVGFGRETTGLYLNFGHMF